MGSLIEARGLHVRYGRGRTGVERVDLAVEAGDIVAVLGPNGSGKSTLVRALAGDLRPTAGSVHTSRSRTGYAPDEAVHADALSVLENASLFAHANGGEDAVAAVGPLLERFGLGGDGALPAGELSFGGRRKLMLVQALAHAPTLLLLDEPTVGLDPRAIDALFACMRDIAAARGAVVFASNDVAAAGSVATRVVFLRAGGKVADDAPAALLARVNGGARIEIDAPSPRPDVVFPDAARVTPTDTGWVLETAAGAAVLPDVCGALASAGAAVSAIRVHDIDLADAFRVLTGEAWRPVEKDERA